ncbi:MAG: SusC/RagA family protein, partial [Chitinophagaceae bacterium]|nr:SusC/RagA family protein [Chitinophagaceae bacterium]
MRLTAFLLLAGCIHVSARTVSQTITFSGKDVTLKEVFTAVESQTDYGIVYDYSWLDDTKPITIKAVDKPLKEFLAEAFKSQPLEFSIDGKTVIVKKKIADATPKLDLITNDANPIKGVIRDAEGNPLGGINIVIKGTKKGVVSDA